MEKLFAEFCEMFNLIFHNIPVPMILVDKNGDIKAINWAYRDFLKLSDVDDIHKNIVDFIPNSRAPIVLQTGKPEIAQKMTYLHGQEAIVHRIPLINNGKVYGLFGMVLFKNMLELEKLLEQNILIQKELDYYKNQLKKYYSTKYSINNIIGSSKIMVELIQNIRRVSNLRSNVLITGESGVGKELCAHAIHSEGTRKDFPFVRVNCTAIPESLIEAELFGYEEGAFTDAKKGGHIGKFEQAHRGTVFLDEIGDMPLRMQAKLLRVIQEKEIERIGGNKLISVDVRIIAATNCNLEDKIKNGSFRQDLYYRLNVLSIKVPALREHIEDIPLLINHFLSELHSETSFFKKISNQAIKILQKYQWPGNVRELRNVLEKIVCNIEEDIIQPKHLASYILDTEPKGLSYSPNINEDGVGLEEIINESEKNAIINALKETSCNCSKAAQLLNIHRSKLYRKLKKYNINLDSYTK
ncbi:MAG: sigma-54 interaction domain-containing protein [Bacillota bacterium]